MLLRAAAFAFFPLVQLASLYAAVLALAADTVTSIGSSLAERAGKGASRCLKTALGLAGGGSEGDEQQGSFLSYAAAAAAGLQQTVTTAFHEKSFWTATALLDLSALWAVWRRHKTAHAEAAATASVRRAAADPANAATNTVQEPRRQVDLPLLRRAAAHSKAAYGAPAAKGELASAASYLNLITLAQATGKAPRHFPATAHLKALQQLTGCQPGDVLAAQWQSHLHRPAFYVAIDRVARRVVVCIRGTLQLGDFCTVLDAVPQPISLCGVDGHVHGGFLAAARNLLPPVVAALRAAAAQVPGFPVLICGHSLGGGVAAVLTMLLAEHRQQAEQHAEEGRRWQPQGQLEQLQQQAADPLWQLGEVECIGVGAAAAFDEQLGMACRQHVTSVLFGMDCLPMFSVLGARLLIEEVHAKSKAAALVAGLLRQARAFRSGKSSGAATGPAAAAASRCHSRASSLGGLGGSSSSSALDRTASAASSLSELSEAEDEACGSGGSRLRRCGSAWSSASSVSIAAFATDSIQAERGGGGAALVPMFPPGRILWMLPDEQRPEAPPQLVETSQQAFERFLFTLETTHHHLPDTYTDALGRL